MIGLDFDVLETDVLKKLKHENITQVSAAKQMGLSRGVFRNLREKENIRIKTLLSVFNWLGNEPERYFKQGNKI